jgi:hypothetical protein
VLPTFTIFKVLINPLWADLIHQLQCNLN